MTVDFSRVTACGGSCTNCPKKQSGICPGCIEADGYVPEWADSGRCRIHACVKKNGVLFCGLCSEFPCDKLPDIIHWEPDCIEKLSALRKQYQEQTDSAVNGI